MSDSYDAFENLRKHNAVLHNSVALHDGIQLAAWSNKRDTITQYCNHHTLSLYIADGYESYHKTASGWKNGGGPDRFCLMPKESESVWDIRDNLAFVHLYCTDEHLREVGEKVWDRSPANFTLDEKTFSQDASITALYRQFLLGCDWQQNANQLTLSTASTLLLTHLVQHYSNVQWQLPTITGGLAPVAQRNVLEYIEAHLGEPLLLCDLAAQVSLSEYHFARMFRQSMGVAPHQFVMQRRMARAKALLLSSNRSLTDIALACGFNSASHFSNRFKAAKGITPSQLRATQKR
ncbi:AraC family transcriptional regulator [Kosakonia cowanii JCM 10956 = DSM 18146]|uniref:AraC family transcriptional regulator n=1 Tax=Kosakonia cowanii JCM 10956 = DSM 18146 TaxID=1300165 RepID=A0A807LGU5_9ENTR|nr:helix-turn-helix domain-containing protein [Kosakonia cowanii]APZ06567.1 AraC family transcriptional regulator [Kosakonia cowanii JCM 10956 = DSM 18146]